MGKPIRVAVVQAPPVFLNLKASVDKVIAAITETSAKEADLVVFPETWLPGYPLWFDHAPSAAQWNHPPAKQLFRRLHDNALTIGDEHYQAICAAVKKHQIAMVIGVHEKKGASLYNTMLFFHPDGETVHHHRKLVPTYTERLVWGRGDGSTIDVLETPFGNLGGLVCWEHWMPLARAALHNLGEVVHVAQWPTVSELHQIASRQYAFEGQCFVIASGCTFSRGDMLEGYLSLGHKSDPAYALLESVPGPDDRLLMQGGSAVIGPSAAYVAEPLFDSTETVYADLDPADIAEGRLTMDSDGHYSRPDVFQLTVNRQKLRNVVFRENGNEPARN